MAAIPGAPTWGAGMTPELAALIAQNGPARETTLASTAAMPAGVGGLAVGPRAPIFGPGGRFANAGGSFGGGGGGGTLPGATPTGGSAAAGSIPGVTNPAGTIAGNLGNIGGIIGGITDQQLESLRKQYPTEYFATLQQLLGNTQRRAGGDISDLLPELQVRNAEAGVAGGYSGSAMENTKLLRDLGLTRYGVEEQALKDLGLIQSGTPTVKPFDPSQIIAALTNAQAQADINRAAPDPEAANQLARHAAGAVGGGGGGTGGVRYGGGGGGGGIGGGGTVDDVLKRYGGGIGYGGPIIARGTRVGALPNADYENVIKPWESGTMGGEAGPLGSGEFDAMGQIGADQFGGYDEYGDNQDYSGYDDYTGGGGGGDNYDEQYY